jgi:hypothetical protein
LFSLTTQAPGTAPVDYSNVECGATFTNLLNGTSINFTGGGYACTGDSSCTAQLTWTIPGGTPSSGTGSPSFTLNNSGTFTLTMHGYCGGKLCDSCQLRFTTHEDCNCGSWKPFDITTSVASYTNQSCGTIYQSKKGVPITVSGSYACSDTACDPIYTWTIYYNSAFFLSGTTFPVSFTPNTVGTYLVVIGAQCGGNNCDSCSFTFKVKKLIQQPLTPMNRKESILEISAKPNPAHNNVTIRLSSSEKESGMITWYNELGIMVEQMHVAWNGGDNDAEMNVSSLPAGIYMVKFTGENGSAFVKVTVYR